MKSTNSSGHEYLPGFHHWLIHGISLSSWLYLKLCCDALTCNCRKPFIRTVTLTLGLFAFCFEIFIYSSTCRTCILILSG